MNYRYHCPHCDGRLNPNIKIILRAELRGKRGLILMSAQPGNYEIIIPPEFDLRHKDEVAFSCPICGHDLTSNRENTMTELRFLTTTGSSGTVAFSRIFGHHATYFITGDQVKSYGEDADENGVKFWGVGPGA